MGRQISRDVLTDGIVKGIESAQKFYEDCAGVWDVPEYLLCAHIAEKIHQLDGAKYVTLEWSVRDALLDARANSVGRPTRSLRRNGRFDAVVWWGNGQPRAAIEVKRNVWAFDNLRSDIARIKDVLRQNREETSFEFGAIGFGLSCGDNTSERAPQALQKRIDDLRDKTERYAGVKVIKRIGEFQCQRGTARTAVCFVLCRP